VSQQPPQDAPPPDPGVPYAPPPPGQPGTGHYAGPPPKKSRTGLIIFLSILGGFLLLCGGCGVLAAVGGLGESSQPGPSASSGGASANDRSATSTPAKGPAAGRIGTPVRDGKFEFTVKSMKCGVRQVGPQYFEHKAQGRFCLVTMTAENIGSDPQTLFDANQKGFVGTKSYAADSEAGFSANVGSDGNPTDVWINEINPGNSVTGVMVWDLPAGAKLTKLELHDSAFSGGVEVTL
jgi:hypothetical protein